MIIATIQTFEGVGHGLPFLVSRQGGFAFALALQHQPNSQWFSDL